MAQNRVYEDFQPPHDWAHDERSHTLILPLEGFSRNQLKVQITSARKIRVSGERQIEGNKWRRFYIEFPAPQDSDTNDIGAKFERGTLYIRFPKLITPAVMPPQPSPPPTQQAPPPPPPTTQQAPPPPPPPPKPASREEPKAEEAIEKKPERRDETKMEQKEKEPPKEKEKEKKEDISEGKELKEEAKAKAKGKAPEAEEHYYKEEESRRPSSASLSSRLSSLKAQDYKDAIVGLVGEMKKQKDVINRLVVVFIVLLLGLYLKHLLVSTFGGSNKTHHEL